MSNIVGNKNLVTTGNRLTAFLWLVEISLTCFLGIAVGYVVIALIGDALPIKADLSSVKSVYGNSTQVVAPSKDQNFFDYLTSYDPFFGNETITSQLAEAKAPESSLDITLYGLRYDEGGNSSVILKIQGEDQKRVVAGEAINNMVRLLTIYPDRIEIARNGQRESVSYKQESAFSGLTQSLSEAPSKTVNSHSIVPSDEKLNDGEVQNLINLLELEPLRNEGRIQGFVITATNQDMVLSAVGLQQQDVILSVNGNVLDTVERLSELPDEVRGQSSLSIQLLRRGEQMTKSLSLASLGLQ